MLPVASLIGSIPRRAVVLILLVASALSWQSSEAAEPGGEIRVASYNVENYVTMARRIDGRIRVNAGKPEGEKEAVVRMIASVRPDILGLMEIGEPRQLEDLQRRLRMAGIDYPHSEYLQGSDSKRHIALLSRYPIVERHSQGDLPVDVDGVTLHSPRGILDVTVEPSRGYRLRLLCVHLKAKLEIEEYDQQHLRESEARAMRKRVRGILQDNVAERLLLMGDFNDTKNETAIRTIMGKPEWPDSLRPLPLADDRGEFWTEYWSAADVYSRIDYIMVTKKLEQEIDLHRSGIARPSFWNEASDHCPLYISLKIPAPSSP